jgi:hypothetical protein
MPDQGTNHAVSAVGRRQGRPSECQVTVHIAIAYRQFREKN